MSLSAHTFTKWSDVEAQRFTRPAKFRICHKGIFEKHCPVSTKMGKDVNRNRNEMGSNQEMDCGIFWNYSLLMLFFIEGEGVNSCRGGGDGLRWHKMTVRPANRWELLPHCQPLRKRTHQPQSGENSINKIPASKRWKGIFDRGCVGKSYYQAGKRLSDVS